MKPPQNIEVIEWDSSTFWFDELGILCSIQKKTNSPTLLADAIKNVEDFKKLVGDKKVCMLIDVTYTPESSKEIRDYAAAEFPKFVKAIAMISKSPLGKMLANLFFNLKIQPYPTKMFNDEQAAREWLKQYL